MNYLQKELYDQIQTDNKIFEFVQNSSLDGMWYWDLENPEEEWMNDTFWQTLGYDPKEKKHKASEWQDIIDKEDLELAIGNFKAHCADPSHAYDQVVRYKHKNGSTVWIRCKGLAIRNDEGVPIRMLGAHVDITAQKKSELLLKQKVEKYDLIVEGSSIGTWEWNKETGEFVFNKQLASILGISTNEKIVYSDFIISITHPDDRLEVQTQIGELINQSLTNLDLEVRIMTKFNVWVWVKIQGHIPIETEYKYTDWIIGTLIDVTKRKET